MKQVLLFLLVFIVLSCNGKKDVVRLNQQDLRLAAPSGTIKVSENFYADAEEVQNINYREYLFWIIRVFGENSTTFKNAQIDTNNWDERQLQLTAHQKKYYLKHQAYSYFPLVGVTLKQAEAYCKWRSDRIYEKILIEKRVIELNTEQDSTNYFSIESYLAGRYKGHKAVKTIPYPVYRLPSPKEWEQIALAEVQQNSKNCQKSRKTAQKVVTTFDGTMYNSRESYDKKMHEPAVPAVTKAFTAPTQSYFEDCLGMFNLFGNVAEMTSAAGVAKGGSWAHAVSTFKPETNYLYTNPSAWLGFRCVCSWQMPEGSKL